MKQQGHFDTSKEAVQIWKMIVDFDRYVQLLNATLRPKSSVRGYPTDPTPPIRFSRGCLQLAAII